LTSQARIDRIRGRILDVDTHEIVPRTMWAQEFGEAGEVMAQAFPPSNGPNQAGTLEVTSDSTPINADTVWNTKGPRAPGASDMTRRIEVMAQMGVDRQFVFPGFVLNGFFAATADEDEVRQILSVPPERELPDLAPIIRESVTAHNAWAIRNSKISSRIRPVGVVMTSSLEQMMADAQRVITEGVRAIWVPVGSPPAGTSPADRVLDPFWALLADSKVPMIMHVGSDQNFHKTKTWKRNVPEFEFQINSADMELGLDPWTLANMHLPPQNFMITMVLGGVFERHPDLRCAAIEFGAHWVGPMAEHCDLMAEQFAGRLSKTLSMRPSEYLRRSFRASVFDFEHINLYFERYNMPEVFCFATDFPHIEGGRQPMTELAERLNGFDDATFDNFFIHNAELLMPA
jgi:predicted TIM-barrel fold metal-dependent hydrolase